MQLVEGSERFPPSDRGCVLTIGNFDGVHLGHRAVLTAAIERARSLGCPSVAYTFDPHPRRVLDPGRSQPLLTTQAQLEELLAEIGIAMLVRERFTLEFASITPEGFLREILRVRIAPRELFVGRDFHFGRDRGGSGETLARVAPTLGMRVVFVPEVQVGGRDVSSTRIRESLARGDVEDAMRCLGRAYGIRGAVVPGARRGRGLGFPTANLETENELLPARGVYATRVRFLDGAEKDRALWPSVTNVGTRPTFEGDRLIPEVHLIGFDGDLYGRPLEVRFAARLREEKRFESLDALRGQIAADVARARSIFQDPGR
jgi:riboflavin kinase/FMN adenylyltransferase